MAPLNAAESAASGRMGVYGGSFDPPHLDHVRMVEAFAHQFDLERLWVLPTGDAWHKATTHTSAVHRLAMAHLAFKDMSLPKACTCVVDDREIRRVGPSYTFDSLQELMPHAPQAHWFLLVGQDQMERFDTWYRWRDIAGIATIVVAKRSLQESDENSFELKFDFPSVPPAASRPKVLPLDWVGDGISSTDIRQKVQSSGPDISSDVLTMVQPAVASYISQQQLYSLHT